VEARGREILRVDARPVSTADHGGAFAEAVVQALRSEVPVPAAFQPVVPGAAPTMLQALDFRGRVTKAATRHLPAGLYDAADCFGGSKVQGAEFAEPGQIGDSRPSCSAQRSAGLECPH